VQMRRWPRQLNVQDDDPESESTLAEGGLEGKGTKSNRQTPMGKKRSSVFHGQRRRRRPFGSVDLPNKMRFDEEDRAEDEEKDAEEDAEGDHDEDHDKDHEKDHNEDHDEGEVDDEEEHEKVDAEEGQEEEDDDDERTSPPQGPLPPQTEKRPDILSNLNILPTTDTNKDKLPPGLEPNKGPISRIKESGFLKKHITITLDQTNLSAYEGELLSTALKRPIQGAQVAPVNEFDEASLAEPVVPLLSSGGSQRNHASQEDYQIQLMLLEQKNKKRFLMARQEQDSINHVPRNTPDQGPFAPNMSPSGGSQRTQTLQEYQMQLTLLEQKNKKRFLMARQEQDNINHVPRNTPEGPFAPNISPSGGSQRTQTLQEYQMQLMLLEQKNKKRLWVSRQEQDNINHVLRNTPEGPFAPNISPSGGSQRTQTLQEYQMQLMLLEQKNKKRLWVSRQEQDNINHVPGNTPGQGPFALDISPSGSRAVLSPNPDDRVGEVAGTNEINQGTLSSPAMLLEPTHHELPSAMQRKMSDANNPAMMGQPPRSHPAFNPGRPGLPSSDRNIEASRPNPSLSLNPNA
jgi:hypothetical protein